jgi:DNA mismatch repair ATPase MutS
MASRGILFFAATHDRELTGYLEQEVRNMHFEERMDGADITFSYELLEGPASTKNALLLLRNMGFPEDLVLRAEILSESLDET